MLGQISCRLRALGRKADSAAGFPSIFFLETTSACNLKCPSCPRIYSKRPRNHIEESTFRKTIQEISSERPDIKHIGLHWFGEPLLNPGLFDLVEIARTYLPNAALGFSSNGNLLSPQKINQLLNSQISSLGIWPDTTDPEIYDKVRQGGQLNRVEQAIVELLEKREELGREDIGIGVGTVIYKNNMSSFKHFRNKWETIFAKYNNVGVYAQESHDWAGQVPADNVLNSTGNSKIHIKRICFMPFAFCIVSSEGYVTPCCYDCNLRLTWGNIKTNSIREIWNGPEARALRMRLLTGRITPSDLCYTCHNYRQSITSILSRSSIRKIPLIGRIFQRDYADYFLTLQ